MTTEMGGAAQQRAGRLAHIEPRGDSDNNGVCGFIYAVCVCVCVSVYAVHVTLERWRDE